MNRKPEKTKSIPLRPRFFSTSGNKAAFSSKVKHTILHNYQGNIEISEDDYIYRMSPYILKSWVSQTIIFD